MTVKEKNHVNELLCFMWHYSQKPIRQVNYLHLMACSPKLGK